MNKNIIIIAVILIVIIGGIILMAQNRPDGGNGQNQNSSSSSSSQESSVSSVSSSLNNKVTYIKGMKIEVLKEGTGIEAKAGDEVSVHYTGTLANGKKFDSSVDRGEPFAFTLGQNRVIQGWELGVLGMKVGEKRKLTIPPELGYGSRDVGDGLIPPNSTLIFEVELLGINQ